MKISKNVEEMDKLKKKTSFFRQLDIGLIRERSTFLRENVYTGVESKYVENKITSVFTTNKICNHVQLIITSKNN